MSTFRTASDSTPPKPRNPYPMNRTAKEAETPIPDGPTEPIGARRVVKRRNWGVFLATLVALFALNVAGVAIFVAWRASYLARAALQPPPPPPAAVAPTGDGFDVSYAQEPLRVQVGCSAVLFLDLDEPRSNAAEKVSDLRYDSRCGDQPPSLTLGAGAAAGSQVKSNDTDAAGCAKAIRTSPIGPGASIPVRKGTVLCVLTAAAPARMALVEITDVGRTGTAGMRATSWKVAG
ncbi:hypothetical protein JIG36_50255 [Actinoplanes sp. LDG1-06]|uniref:Uncharacterized protein n=1 Tax=Paractinoplanes ovalisporus TaxID=2810368 RepID=A0ABS2AV41_9ACTN|nr:hypothetical protein [Actinoplanes ovalisporus]MBM2623701.1 hypothetical protein [Actinoplanes ovalisporus]